MENYGWESLEGYSGIDPLDRSYIRGHTTPTDDNLYMSAILNEDPFGYIGLPDDSHVDGGLEITLRMAELPLVGQSATAVLEVRSPDTAPATNAVFRLLFIGDVEVSSSDQELVLDEYSTEGTAGQTFYTPSVHILPGGLHQFSVTITPLSETSIRIHADGFDEVTTYYYSPVATTQYGDFVTSSGDDLYLSIGNQTSGYQLDKDSYARDPDTEYIWTQRPHPQCWSTPWHDSGQTVQDYYHGLGMEVLDTWFLNYPGDVCLGCNCRGGSVLFLTPASDYNAIPSIGFIEH